MVISSLPPEYEQFVQAEVASGRFRTPVELVCEALRQYQERQQQLGALKEEIQIGLDELRRGDFIEILNETELDAYFDDLEARGRQRLAKQNPT